MVEQYKFTKLANQFRAVQLESMQMLSFDLDMPAVLTLRIGGFALRMFSTAKDQLRSRADALTASDIDFYNQLKTYSLVLVEELADILPGLLIAASLNEGPLSVLAIAKLANDAALIMQQEVFELEFANQLNNEALGDEALLKELESAI